MHIKNTLQLQRSTVSPMEVQSIQYASSHCFKERHQVNSSYAAMLIRLQMTSNMNIASKNRVAWHYRTLKHCPRIHGILAGVYTLATWNFGFCCHASTKCSDIAEVLKDHHNHQHHSPPLVLRLLRLLLLLLLLLLMLLLLSFCCWTKRRHDVASTLPTTSPPLLCQLPYSLNVFDHSYLMCVFMIFSLRFGPSSCSWWCCTWLR